MIDKVAIAFQNPYDAVGMQALYTGISNNLESEVTVLLIHIAQDNAEMLEIFVGFTLWHANWGQDDYDFFYRVKSQEFIEKYRYQTD